MNLTAKQEGVISNGVLLMKRVMIANMCVTGWPDTLFPLKLFLRNPQSEVKVDETPMHPVKSSALG
jgi:hypothetical protein